MKVAIYAGMYIKDQDGATKTLYELTGSLLKKKIKVGVWAFSLTPADTPGLSLYRVMSWPLVIYKDYRMSIPSFRSARQLREFSPDVIHISVADFMGLFFLRYALKHGIPVITSFHTDFPSYLKSYKLAPFESLLWRYLRFFYNKCRAVFAPTREFQKRLTDHDIRQVKIWSRGIHRENYSPAFRSVKLRESWGGDHRKIILYAGRFVWYKNLQVVIDIYERFVSGSFRDVRFVMAGDGPIRNELERRMPGAVFTGYVTGRELSEVYASSDIFLFPSTTETFGNVIQEALASGVPAVVSDVGGCQEIISNSHGGLIADADNADHFYHHLSRLLDDRDLYSDLRASGLHYAELQNWETINQVVIDEYYSVCRTPEIPESTTDSSPEIIR